MVSLSLLLGVNLALHSVREGQVGRGRDPLDRFDGLIFGFRVFVREGDGRACHGMFDIEPPRVSRRPLGLS